MPIEITQKEWIKKSNNWERPVFWNYPNTYVKLELIICEECKKIIARPKGSTLCVKCCENKKRKWRYGGYMAKIKTIQCYFCRKKENIHIHHIDKNRNNNHAKNLVILCCGCHRKLHTKIYETFSI